MKKGYLLLIGLFILFTLNPVLAAPAPWGIAINSNLKQCENYWAGDEFGTFPLKEGFESFYPESAYRVFDTSLGKCKNTSFHDRELTENWKKCFVSLNCDYIKFEDINQTIRELIKNNFSCFNISNKNFWGTSLIIDLKNNKCSLLTCGSPPNQKFMQGNFELIFEPDKYISFYTTMGNCTIKEKGINFSECCTQLELNAQNKKSGFFEKLFNFIKNLFK